MEVVGGLIAIMLIWWALKGRSKAKRKAEAQRAEAEEEAKRADEEKL